MDRVHSPLHPREGVGPEAMCLLRGVATRLPLERVVGTRLPLERVVGTRLHPGAGTHHRRHPVGVMANTSNPRTRG